jgi:hypothetical protein
MVGIVSLISNGDIGIKAVDQFMGESDVIALARRDAKTRLRGNHAPTRRLGRDATQPNRITL